MRHFKKEITELYRDSQFNEGAMASPGQQSGVKRNEDVRRTEEWLLSGGNDSFGLVEICINNVIMRKHT